MNTYPRIKIKKSLQLMILLFLILFLRIESYGATAYYQTVLGALFVPAGEEIVMKDDASLCFALPARPVHSVTIHVILPPACKKSEYSSYYANYGLEDYSVAMSYYGNDADLYRWEQTLHDGELYDRTNTLHLTLEGTSNGMKEGKDWYFFRVSFANRDEDDDLYYCATVNEKISGKKVKVQLSANGGSVSKKSMTSSKGNCYGNLPVPTRKGYTFCGWFTKKNGGTKVTEETLVTKGSTHTLYAHWKLAKYTIAFECNGGSFSSRTKVPSTYTKNNTVTLPKPSRKGYIFGGWYKTSSCKGSRITRIARGSSGSRMFYAKWTAVRYSIAFKGNGASSGRMSKISGLKFGKTYTLPSNKFKKKGWYFIGWAKKASGTVKYGNKSNVKNLSSVNGKTITLYAKWSRTKPSVLNPDPDPYEETQWSEWSDWSTESATPSDSVIVESKYQYRYSDKQTTTSSSDSLSGWISDGSETSYGEYGPWSAWNRGSMSGSDTREVQTATVYGYYYFQCPNCGAHMHGYPTCWTWAGGCGYKGTSLANAVNVFDPTPHSSAGFYDWHGTGKWATDSIPQYGRLFKWDDNGVTAWAGYRYRDRSKTVTYKYYRWSEWSDWSDTMYYSDSSRDVESRVVYRSKHVIG